MKNSTILSENSKRQVLKRIIPGHCTGSKVIDRFAVEFGNDCLQSGIGRIIEI
jgi:metal-dependent hydrolase (beta-lactamase superfamily II)